MQPSAAKPCIEKPQFTRYCRVGPVNALARHDGLQRHAQEAANSSGGPRFSRHRPQREEHDDMLDILFVALTVTFFALAYGYAKLCERL